MDHILELKSEGTEFSAISSQFTQNSLQQSEWGHLHHRIRWL